MNSYDKPRDTHTIQFLKGRGAGSNVASRFDAFQREALAPEQQDWPGDDEAIAAQDDEPSRPKTVVVEQMARSAATSRPT
jgi:hypothetical protein